LVVDLEVGMARTLLGMVLLFTFNAVRADDGGHDIVVYGGTSGGVAAAVQARRMGKTVVIIEPGKRLGGLSSGGLGQTDIGNKAAIGGIARDFYVRVARHYAEPAAWKWQKREEYRDSGQTRTAQDEASMWTFEPSVALKIFDDLVREQDIKVVFGERLERKKGVASSAGRITSITMESGRVFHGRMFIDATYEGDLLASAGVAYTVGREANSRYGETLNGVQTKNAVHHQLVKAVDPYLVKGDARSGLLPGIDAAGPGVEGEGDHRVQAYCFRMCLTDHPDNRIPFHKPAGYDPLRYELMLRNFEAGERGMPWINSSMPNRKTDTNNRAGFSTDFIGQNYAYPDADYATREKIVAEHLVYQQGLMWTLANDPRVPAAIRKEVSRWGMCKDEFTDNGGWQAQIYVREARRMIGAYVMTQHDCQGRKIADDAVGLAAYTMDSHNVQRYVDKNGHARNEGDVQVGGFSPYPISYRAIVPRDSECANLLVPVCLSASHIAFGSIRMEPVFMVLGQSAATAACLALEDGVSVQGIDYSKLRARLLADKQVLKWTGPKTSAATSIDPKKLAGIVVDDEDAELQGFDPQSVSIGPYVGTGYRHDDKAADGKHIARFVPNIKTAGDYEIRLSYTANANRASKVPVVIRHAGGMSQTFVDQRKAPPLEGAFISLGRFRFDAGKAGSVEISNRGVNGYVVIDAVQFVPVPEKR